MDMVERQNMEKSRSLSDSQASMLSVAEGESVISIRNFNLWYGDFQALRNISLEISKNKATAFIGPSGCGKSTLLRAFNRMCDFAPREPSRLRAATSSRPSPTSFASW